MAQRVFLVQMPQDALDLAVSAICGERAERRSAAAALADAGADHLRRVAVSERVIEAAQRGREPPEDWNTARYCMPYLLAAPRADEIGRSLDALAELRDEDSLEAFFVEQARALGMSPEGLDRERFQPPPAASVADAIAQLFDAAADLRGKALAWKGKTGEELDPVADYAISTWFCLGQIFAETRPAFWQGRNQWLGGAAFPDAFSLQTSVTTFGSPRTTRRTRSSRA